MQTALEVLLAFVALYPVVTAALWIAGGLMFRLWEERPGDRGWSPTGGWPGVSVLIPAYNEEAVIATSVRAALDSDYPRVRGAGPRRRLHATTPRRRRSRRRPATGACACCVTPSTAARPSSSTPDSRAPGMSWCSSPTPTPTCTRTRSGISWRGSSPRRCWRPWRARRTSPIAMACSARCRCSKPRRSSG